MGRRHPDHDASVYDAVGSAIRRARGKRTQAWLAETAGIDQTMVSEYELNRTRIPLDVLGKIEAALDLTRGQLLVDAGVVEARHVPTRTSTESAITEDSLLDDGFKEQMLDFYRFAVERTAAYRRQVVPTAEDLAAIGPPFDHPLQAQIWADPELIDEHRRVLIWRHQRGLLRGDNNDVDSQAS